MSDDRDLTKRQRQKARREAKQQALRVQVQKARRRRLVALGLVVVLVVAAVGALVANQLSQRAEQAAAAEEAQARLGELGCTEITEMPDLGREHLNPQQLAQNPPEALYGEDRPGTSGPHLGQVALTGVYDKPIDERLVLHNKEHGYVVFTYAPDAPEDQVAELQEWARQQIADGREKIIVAEYDAEQLPDGASFAATAWGHRQLCDAFDPQVARVFLDAHHDSPEVPEPGIAPHTSADQPGVIDPAAEDGPLLFPPLGEASGGPTAMPDPGGSTPGAATEGG